MLSSVVCFRYHELQTIGKNLSDIETNHKTGKIITTVIKKYYLNTIEANVYFKITAGNIIKIFLAKRL